MFRSRGHFGQCSHADEHAGVGVDNLVHDDDCHSERHERVILWVARAEQPNIAIHGVAGELGIVTGPR